MLAPYLKDDQFIDDLIKEAYFRTKNELKASHILIQLPKNATPKDTALAYNKIIDARNKILSGNSFESVAAEISEDPSAKRNGGNLGYFSAFKMVYPFEDAAYKTKVGEISMPFKTRFGYHIVKADGLRASRGEVQVAHILINDTTAVGKTKIDDLYKKLQKGEKFEVLTKQFSSDNGTKDKGGVLPKFGTGRMVKPFEDAAFSITKENMYGKPFKTRFGWHIVKLIKKYPVQSFDLMKQEITNNVKKSGRIKLSDKAVLNRLKKEYKIVENEKAKSIFKRADIRNISSDSLQGVLLTINHKNINQSDFIKFIKNRRHKSVAALFEMFKDQEILNYFKENLIHTEPDFAYTLKEYEDGLLLFELMQQKIWKKSSKDTLGLKNYFKKNINNYSSKELKNIKGEVMNDYQTFLEKEWIDNLKKKSKIRVKKKQLKKLIKFYNKKQ